MLQSKKMMIENKLIESASESKYINYDGYIPYGDSEGMLYSEYTQSNTINTEIKDK
jgi:hypothetical protein